MKIFPLTIYVLLKPFIQILPSDSKKKLVGFSHYGHFSNGLKSYHIRGNTEQQRTDYSVAMF
jgi:hypothetical protein